MGRMKHRRSDAVRGELGDPGSDKRSCRSVADAVFRQVIADVIVDNCIRISKPTDTL